MVHRIGMIGAGIMGRRMADRIAAHPGFALMAAWDPQPTSLNALRTVYPSVAAESDAASLIARGDIDCIYIASPPGSHARYAHAAFDKDKAVFCEKPLTVDDQEGLLLVERAERERRKAVVNFSLASAPSFRKIVQVMATDVLGPVVRIDMLVRFKAWPRGWQAAAKWVDEPVEGGFTREVVSHFMFTAQRLTGPIEVVSTKVEHAQAGRAETAIAAEMRAGSVKATLDGRIEGEADDHNLWTVTCARGAMRIRDWHALERLDGDRWMTLESNSVEAMRVEAGRAQLDQLADLLEGRPHALPTLREGLNVQRTIEALLKG